MEYYKIFDLEREPFANTPDPDFFFEAPGHVRCLQQIELAVRLRRGLNIVLGQVGTGKTTLCRRLLRLLSDDRSIRPCLILDPYFSSTREFLLVLTKLFGMPEEPDSASEWQIKENIKARLFELGVEENKALVLAIDEGQKLTTECMEILRELLNYETNEHKLLQIVIFAQPEFLPIIRSLRNFEDRINLLYDLQPLNFRQTAAMVRFRLQKAAEGRPELRKTYFSWPALWRIYRTTGGYPRKIVNLCHKAFMTMIIQNASRVSAAMIRHCIARPSWDRKNANTWKILIVLVLIPALAIGAVFFFQAGQRNDPRQIAANTTSAFGPEAMFTSPVQKHDQADTSPGTDTEAQNASLRQSESTAIQTVDDMNEDNSSVDGSLSEWVANNSTMAHGDASQSLETAIPTARSQEPANASRKVAAPDASASVRTTQQAEEHGAMDEKPESPPDQAPQPVQKSLGTVLIEEGFVPFLIARRVTGLRTITELAPYMRAMQELNPHIEDIGKLEVGQNLNIPAMPMSRLQAPTHFIAFARNLNFTQAFELARKSDAFSAGPLTMLSCTLPDKDSISFFLVLPRIFEDSDQALKYLNTLSAFEDRRPELLTLPAETILYTAFPDKGQDLTTPTGS